MITIHSFHLKLEYYVCLTCLHPNRENDNHGPIPKSTPSICLTFLSESPQLWSVVAVAWLALRLALRIALITLLSGGSQHSSEILATLSAGAGAGVPVEAIYRCRIEAAAPNLVPTALRGALRSPTSQLRAILKVLQVVRMIVGVRLLL